MEGNRILTTNCLSDDCAGFHGGGYILVFEEDCICFWAREFQDFTGGLYEDCRFPSFRPSVSH